MNGRTRKWGLTLVGTGMYFSFTYAWNSLAALITVISADLALSEFQTGILLGTVALTIFLTWPIVGPWVERVGPARAMGSGVVLIALAGMSRALLDSFPGFVLAMAAVSLGGSTVTYGLPSVVSSWFTPDESGTPMGIVTVGATLGTVLSFDTMPHIANTVGGWRPALVVSGVPALLFGGAWILVGGVGPHRDENSTSPDVEEVLELLRRPDVLTLVLAGGTYLFATHSIYGWLSPLLVGRGLTTEISTQLVAVVTGGMILGSLVIPYLADVTGRHAGFVGLAGVVFALTVGALSTLPTQFLVLAAVGLITGVAIGGISPLLRTLPLDMVESGSISTVIGMIFGIGALGGFVGPVVIGGIRSLTGWNSAGFFVIALPGLFFLGIAARLYRE